MYRVLAIAFAAALVAGPSLAATTCSKAPTSKFQPQDALKKQLETEGMKVRQIKVDVAATRSMLSTRRARR